MGDLIRVDTDKKYQKKGFAVYVDEESGVYSEVYSYIIEDGKKVPVEILKKPDIPKVDENYEYEKFSPKFIKVTPEHLKLMERLMKKNLQAALMYNFFLDNMDKTNALIISYDAMEELFGKSRTTLWRYISFLVDEKVIEVHTTGQSNIYCINASLAWAQTEELKRFARFNASVVISEKEATTKYVTTRIEPKGKKGITKKKK